MAQGRLIAAIVVLGVAAELAGPDVSGAPLAGDLLTGVAIGAGGAWLLGRTSTVAPGSGRFRPRGAAGTAGLLALATAVAWFAGTLKGSPVAALDAFGTACVLAYRGPLLHLLLGAVAGRAASVLAVAAWVGAFLPSPVTVVVALGVAVLAALQARRAGSDRRRALLATALVSAALAAVWAAAIALGGSLTLTLLNDATVLAAVAVGLASAQGLWARAAAGRLVVALGRERHTGRPVTAQLAQALADPGLTLSYALPGLGWVDERGQAVAPPGVGGRVVTRAALPGGGEVALTHAGTADPGLTAAATSAAALALDVARLEAELRATAAGLRASRRRLLATADDERRALEERLNDRVLSRLRRVDRLLGDDGARGELLAVRAELAALGRGLYPPVLVRADIGEALGELAGRAQVTTSVAVEGDGDLPNGHRAALWFICAEALANVDKHAGATSAKVRLRVDRRTVTLELSDDGRGGAIPRRGLRGISDRVEALGGRLEITSPPGGPTHVTAELPI